METKELLGTMTEAIEKSLPTIVDTAIEKKLEKMDNSEIINELKEEITNVKTVMKKSSTGSKNEGIEKVGKFWKAFVKKDFAQVKELSEGTDADGGYLVPTEFHNEVIRVANLSGVARRLCRKIPMGTDTKDVSTLASTVTAYIVGEGSSITASQPAFGQVQLVARKFAALVNSTEELIDDNMSNEEVMTLVAKLVADALTELEDSQVLTGNGSGMNMTGVMSDTGVNVVTMDVGSTSFEDIDYENLVDVKNGLNVKYKKGQKPSWFMSQDVFGNIEKLTDTTGRPLVRESLISPDNYTLMGYPIEISDAMPGSGEDAISTKFIAFGDLNFFALGVRKGLSAEEGYTAGNFEKDIKSLKVKERVAGVNLIPEAFAVLKTAAV